LRKKVSSKMTPVTHKCATGLTEVAVPLVVNRKHVGTFFVGQTLSAKPDAKSWARLLDTMDGIANLKQLQPLRSKYLKGQVVEADALTPLVQMVALHSHRLSRNLKPAKAKTAKKVAGKRTAKKH
jgi:ligand-binding sensor protein